MKADGCGCDACNPILQEMSAWGQERKGSGRAKRVRFAPDNGHGADIPGCRKRADAVEKGLEIDDEQ
jgi:hypothetical protein